MNIPPTISSTPCLIHPVLADVLFGAPPLIQLLSSASLKSLRLTSLALRQIVHNQIKVLRLPSTFRCGPDTYRLTRGRWVHLEVLDLTFISLTTGAVHQMVQQAHWPNLKYLSLNGDTLSARAVKQLSKGCWPKLASVTITYSQKAVQPGVKHLFCDKWPLLKSLQLTHVTLSATAIAKLAKQPWPNLSHLDLSYTDLSNDAISKLASGSWQHIVSLNLGGNQLDTDAITCLGSASWLKLQSLNLEFCQLRLSSVNDLMRGQWPQLRSLRLANNWLFYPSQQMTAVWTGLKKLDLANTGLTAISGAVLESWSTLECLNVSCNNLGKQCQQSLVTAPFASLIRLSVRDTVAKGSSGLSLLSANLSMLEELDFSSGPADRAVMSKVYQGCWPRVRRLCLANNRFVDARLIVVGCWPKLEVLNVDNNGMRPNDAAFLIDYLATTKWPLKELSMRKNPVPVSAVQMLLRQGWPIGLQKLNLPSDFDYSQICKGFIWDVPKEGVVYLREPQWLCQSVLNCLTELTFSDKSMPEADSWWSRD